MARIKPFYGLRYNTDKSGDIRSLVTPPYDVISPQEVRQFYKVSPYNFIRLILGKENKGDGPSNNRYSRAKSFFERWLKEGILVKDHQPSVYLYEQEFNHARKRFGRMGFIALIRLEPSGEGVVFPHEKTFCKPKKDRLCLLKAVEANLSPVFGLYSDPRGRIEKRLKEVSSSKSPVLDFRFEGIRNRFWKVSGQDYILGLQELMRDKKIFIADGHHRYEVACLYHRSKKGDRRIESDYMMMYFSSLEGPGLKVLPTHRVVRGLDKVSWPDLVSLFRQCFQVSEINSAKRLFQKLKAPGPGRHLFGVYSGKGRFLLLELRNKPKTAKSAARPCRKDYYNCLDVVILHRMILGRLLGFKEEGRQGQEILYTRDPGQALSLVESGKYSLAFFMNPPHPTQISAIAAALEKMPHKSTYFYPKPLSGLVVNSLRKDAAIRKSDAVI